MANSKDGYVWTRDSALWQAKYGQRDSERTDSAVAYLNDAIASDSADAAEIALDLLMWSELVSNG